jgi:hypothetical protein
MNVNVYLPDDIGESAKAAELNLSRLLRDAVTDELQRRSIVSQTLEDATEILIDLEHPDGGHYKGRFTGTMIACNERHDIEIYLLSDERVIRYHRGDYCMFELGHDLDIEEDLRATLDEDEYVRAMNSLGLDPIIDI